MMSWIAKALPIVGSVSRLTQALGERGERVAEMWLQTKGWTILDRRFRNGHRDIDLIASRTGEEGRLIAFVEVKARLSSGFGGPIGAVNWKKQRELCKSANIWISRHPMTADLFRFDVIGVHFDRGRVRVRHVENAFLVPTRT
jgi:putative endonuclease